MKLVLVSIVLCAAICIASATTLLASSSHQLNRQETNLIRRLFKRQAYNDPNCDRRACAVPNCGKDYIAGVLPGECCERCIPWEYAQSIGLKYPQGPQAVQDPRAQQYQPQYPYNQPQQQQPQQRNDVYIYGPDDGARVSTGQSIYFDCEVSSPYNQQAQPRWSRSGNQPLPLRAQSTTLPGNRKLVRLTIPDATHGDAGRYECSAGTGNPNEQASIDLQVTDGGYYPRPQPQPQPQPQYPQYDPYNQQPRPQPGYYPVQPPPRPHHPQPHPHPHPQPQPGGGDEEDDDVDEEEEPPAKTTHAAHHPTPAPKPAAPAQEADGGTDDGEYPEDYTDNE